MKDLDAQRFLYRCFDRKGRLLYIGLTTDVVKRLMQHGHPSARYSKKWGASLHRIEAERVGTRKLALMAERMAISLEHPLHNVKKVNGEQWDEIVKLRKTGMTLASIGKKFGLSRQRIHQILSDYKDTL